VKELPLSVAISALIKDNKILLIKRVRGDYVGLWGLPGGKIEKNEHVSEAAVREIFEESGIKSEFKNHLGFVSEHLIEDGEVVKHFLLHVCELNPLTTHVTNNEEGRLEWFDLDELEQLKNKIIPSDYPMIKKIVINREKNYYDCVLEKIGEEHVLKKFE
jgi:8-oxo-dGTP diphosphatase